MTSDEGNGEDNDNDDDNNDLIKMVIDEIGSKFFWASSVVTVLIIYPSKYLSDPLTKVKSFNEWEWEAYGGGTNALPTPLAAASAELERSGVHN